MPFINKRVFAAFLLFFTVGCQHLPRVGMVIEPSKSEKAITELSIKQAEEIKKFNAQIASFEETFKQKFDANISLGSASVMSALDTLNADSTKDKYTLAAIPALEVAVAALPQPTLADYKKTSETQRKLLSEQAKEIEAGKAEITAQKGEAAAAKEAQRIALAEKARIEKEKDDSATAFNAEKDRLKSEAIKEMAGLAAAKQKEIDDAKLKDKAALQALIVKILMGVGILAAILTFVLKGPGQLFNPIIGIISALSIGLAIAVSFLPTWALMTALGVLFGSVILVILYELKRYKDIAKVSVGAIEERKNSHPEEFTNGLANNLKDWTGGHPTLEKNIDALAKELNVKSK